MLQNTHDHSVLSLSRVSYRSVHRCTEHTCWGCSSASVVQWVPPWDLLHDLTWRLESLRWRVELLVLETNRSIVVLLMIGNWANLIDEKDEDRWHPKLGLPSMSVVCTIGKWSGSSPRYFVQIEVDKWQRTPTSICGFSRLLILYVRFVLVGIRNGSGRVLKRKRISFQEWTGSVRSNRCKQPRKRALVKPYLMQNEAGSLLGCRRWKLTFVSDNPVARTSTRTREGRESEKSVASIEQIKYLGIKIVLGWICIEGTGRVGRCEKC